MKRGRIRGTVGEFMIVVLGVLVALAVDQWWERFEDNELTDFYLSAIEDDLRQDSTDLEWLINRSSLIVGSADTWLAALNSGSVSAFDEDFTNDLVGLFLSGEINLNSAAFQDMRSSGNLRLLPTPDLRRGLQVYYSHMGVENPFDDVDQTLPEALIDSRAARVVRRIISDGASAIDTAVGPSEVMADFQRDPEVIREWLLRRQFAATLVRREAEFFLSDRTLPRLEAVKGARN